MSRSFVRLILPLVLALGALAACSRKLEAPSAGAPAAPAARAEASKDARQQSGGNPLKMAGAVRPESARKVIYKADLSVEVRSPSDAQAKVSAIVEREGGFVASAARSESEGHASDVTLVLRVPAERFGAVLAEIRRLGDGERAERIDSEDVTDEYVDLEARLRAQTRLEEQLLELLKTATTVEAALKVHTELANVRTEIERITGRKLLLEREVALSTIRLTLNAPATESVSFSRVGKSFSDAWSDAILVAGGIVVGAIRLMGVLVPLAVMFGLPVVFVVLAVRRRMRLRTASANAMAD
jgi:hypothetical protein